jgi:hypothetical protein
MVIESDNLPGEISGTIPELGRNSAFDRPALLEVR